MQTMLNTVLLLLPVVGFTALAQEPVPGEGEAPAAAATAPAGAAAERDATEPAVSTTPAPADARRAIDINRVIDEIVLERTEVTGNQELPKVLYIVPWQKSDPGNLTGKPVNTLLDEVLAPIDRSEFLRQVEYYDELYRNKEE